MVTVTISSVWLKLPLGAVSSPTVNNLQSKLLKNANLAQLKTGLERWKWRPYKVGQLVSKSIYALKCPSPAKAFLYLRPSFLQPSADMPTVLAPLGCTHPPPILSPTYLKPKLKVSHHHTKSFGFKGVCTGAGTAWKYSGWLHGKVNNVLIHHRQQLHLGLDLPEASCFPPSLVRDSASGFCHGRPEQGIWHS